MNTNRKPRRILTGLSIAVAATFAAAGCASDAGSGDGSEPRATTMTLATPTWNAGIASIAVSESMGYFEAEGLDMEVVLTDSASTQLTQVATGKAETGAISPEPIILGHQEGTDIDLSYYMYYYQTNIYGLMVPEDSDIQSIADLEGRTVGAISLASNSVTQLKVALDEEGIDPDSVEFIAIGTGGQQATAVKDGEVEALALLDTSFETLANAGIDLRTIEVPGTASLTAGGLAATTQQLESDPELYTSIGRAIAKGVVFAQANPEAAIRILFEAHPEARPQGISEDEAIANAVRVLEARLSNLGIDDDTSEYGRFDDDALQGNVDFLVNAGEVETAIPVEDFWNDSLIGAINEFDFDEVRTEAEQYGD